MFEETKWSSPGCDNGRDSRKSLAEQEERSDSPAYNLVLLRRDDAVSVLDSGRDRDPAPFILPADRGIGVRKRTFHHGGGAVRLAHSLHSYLGRKPHDLHAVCAHGDRLLHARVPAASHADLD